MIVVMTARKHDAFSAFCRCLILFLVLLDVLCAIISRWSRRFRRTDLDFKSKKGRSDLMSDLLESDLWWNPTVKSKAVFGIVSGMMFLQSKAVGEWAAATFLYS